MCVYFWTQHEGQYIVTCQAHPALVKRVQQSVSIFRFLVVCHYVNFVRIRPPVNGLEDPWPMSRCCLEPRWFVGDPTSLARGNMNSCVYSMLVYSFLYIGVKYVFVYTFFIFIVCQYGMSVTCKSIVNNKNNDGSAVLLGLIEHMKGLFCHPTFHIDGPPSPYKTIYM